jgi:uncharacterized protein (DUF302 family)
MDTDRYTITVTLDAPLDDVEPRVRDALADEGFGVLSEIDVRATLRDKLGEDVGPYKILGACNPPLARAAIAADPDIGALLPCNVLLRGGPDGGTSVAAADPVAMLEIADREELHELGADARERITRALQALAASESR